MDVVWGIVAGCSPWAAAWYGYFLWRMRKKGIEDRREGQLSG